MKQCYYNNNQTYKNKPSYNINPDYDKKMTIINSTVQYSKPKIIGQHVLGFIYINANLI